MHSDIILCVVVNRQKHALAKNNNNIFRPFLLCILQYNKHGNENINKLYIIARLIHLFTYMCLLYSIPICIYSERTHMCQIYI